MPYQASTILASHSGYILLPHARMDYTSESYTGNAVSSQYHTSEFNAVSNRYYTSDNAVSSQYYISDNAVSNRYYTRDNAVSSRYYTNESYTGYILLPHARIYVMPYQASTILASYIPVMPFQGQYYTSDNAVSSQYYTSDNAVPSQYYTSDNAVSSQYYTSELYTGIYPTTQCSYISNAVSSLYYTSELYSERSSRRELRASYTLLPYARISNAVSHQLYF
ncbi:hypothetical protein DPMN_130177 [Dreissena polymorpha]|uniref:Uncharacterized protein n=1 Tax=Dreissena polymorpha TaxID=45954 RepID=A0A9D4H664_DREPO|nr:hypothetical protein DPMN_130177 [Dreissena polymorpha]